MNQICKLKYLHTSLFSFSRGRNAPVQSELRVFLLSFWCRVGRVRFTRRTPSLCSILRVERPSAPSCHRTREPQCVPRANRTHPTSQCLLRWYLVVVTSVLLRNVVERRCCCVCVIAGGVQASSRRGRQRGKLTSEERRLASSEAVCDFSCGDVVGF